MVQAKNPDNRKLDPELKAERRILRELKGISPRAAVRVMTKVIDRFNEEQEAQAQPAAG